MKLSEAPESMRALTGDDDSVGTVSGRETEGDDMTM